MQQQQQEEMQPAPGTLKTPFYKNGLPTLDTLKYNGKINLIDYPDPNEKVTEKPRKHLHSYLIYVKATRNDLKLAYPHLTFKELS